jgi:hypothetical protein
MVQAAGAGYLTVVVVKAIVLGRGHTVAFWSAIGLLLFFIVWAGIHAVQSWRVWPESRSGGAALEHEDRVP